MGPSLSRRIAGRAGWIGLRALNRAGVLGRRGLTTRIRLEGQEVTVPLWSGIGLDHADIPDRHLLGILRALLGLRRGAFVDVGAHVGQTLVKLLVIGDRRPYLGFEPKPRAAAYVRALLAANGRAGDTVVAAAAGEAAGVARLAAAGDLDDAARLVGSAAPRSAGEGEQVSPVPVLAGDQTLAAAGLESLGLLKIDAEGSELEVVRGFEGSIRRDRPPILCEILPFRSVGDGETRRAERARELVDALAELDYTALLCDAEGRMRSVAGAAADRDFADRDFAFVQRADLDRLDSRLAAP